MIDSSAARPTTVRRLVRRLLLVSAVSMTAASGVASSTLWNSNHPPLRRSGVTTLAFTPSPRPPLHLLSATTDAWTTLQLQRGQKGMLAFPNNTNENKKKRRILYYVREPASVVDDENELIVDLEKKNDNNEQQQTRTSKKKKKKNSVSLSVNINPLKTRPFDSSDIRIVRATRETSSSIQKTNNINDTNDGNHNNNGSNDDNSSKGGLQNGKINNNNDKSVQRLLKAKRLLDLSQISPSQRLERMSAQQQQQQQQAIVAVSSSADTVVPMGSYSMRFGGYGSLEEEIEQNDIAVEMRMADTFDSLDNPVDKKSSLFQQQQWNTMTNEQILTSSSSTLSSSSTTTSLSTLSAASTKSFKPPGVGEVGYKTTDNNTKTTLQQQMDGGSRTQVVATPTIQYDPIAAEQLLFAQPTKWVVRNIQIAFPFTVWISKIILDVLRQKEVQNRTIRASELNVIIGNLGPAIIKAGQALASRPDLLPGEYLEELQKLQDDVPTFSNELAFSIVEEELKLKFNDVFELIEKEPVAAASIGQVYKGRLKSNGQTVAIKIQRPNTEEIVALDLYVLRWWGGVYNGIFRLFGRSIDLQNVMDDFGTLLYGEIDYVAEAANARRFSELYAEDAITDVFVPKVYSELTTRKVLTMEWVDGFRLTDSESLEANNLDRKKLVDTLVQCSLRQIMGSGFFHADPHAGNLLATRDGRLCYLDFGMMSYADAAQRNGFLLAVVHIVNRDWSELVRVYQRLGFIPEGTDARPIELALEQALPDVLSADISELNFKNVVGKLGDIMYKFPFSLPPFYISIIRCLGVLEGLAIQVDPKSRIISEAYPYVANRVLTDDSQEELREALRRLIFTADGHIRWSRLESLLDEAKESSGFDIVPAVSKLVDYLISNEGGGLIDDIADQIVFEADSLGQDTLLYIASAFGALSNPDGPAATAKALRILVDHMQNEQEAGNDSTSSVTKAMTKVLSIVVDTLPEPTPAMKRTLKIGRVLGTRGVSTIAATSTKNAATDTIDAVNKFVPLMRKLSQEPKVTSKASEIVARLSERFVSRGLRAVFGLPPPAFETINTSK